MWPSSFNTEDQADERIDFIHPEDDEFDSEEEEEEEKEEGEIDDDDLCIASSQTNTPDEKANQPLDVRAYRFSLQSRDLREELSELPVGSFVRCRNQEDYLPDTLYHATTHEGAENIRNTGIDLRWGGTLFYGYPAFFCFTKLETAWRFALAKHGRNRACVLELAWNSREERIYDVVPKEDPPENHHRFFESAFRDRFEGDRLPTRKTICRAPLFEREDKKTMLRDPSTVGTEIIFLEKPDVVVISEDFWEIPSKETLVCSWNKKHHPQYAGDPYPSPQHYENHGRRRRSRRRRRGRRLVY